ncbi:unnamed protein product [Clavelina lepadiformis]|uniref:Uncharacterized protein n=1 Tax=Clavelina lepadiformis TaxID=159417 RepID=A0ABP0FUV1_CLALP
MDNMRDLPCTQKEIPFEAFNEESKTLDATTIDEKCKAEQYDNAQAEVVADEETELSCTQKEIPVEEFTEYDNAQTEVVADEETDLPGTQKLVFTIKVRPYVSCNGPETSHVVSKS